MTVDAEITSAPSASTLAAATDYLGLTPEQRYAVISEKFPVWLLAEPIVFPRHDLTYGWACRVPGCEAAPTDMQLQFMCWRHTHQYREVKESLSVEEFLGQAKPFHSMLGRGLRRRAGCRICEDNREARRLGYCRYHVKNLDHIRRRRGFNEKDLRQTQPPFPPLPTCAIPRCVHDGEQLCDRCLQLATDVPDLLRAVVEVAGNIREGSRRSGVDCVVGDSGRRRVSKTG